MFKNLRPLPLQGLGPLPWTAALDRYPLQGTSRTLRPLSVRPSVGPQRLRYPPPLLPTPTHSYILTPGGHHVHSVDEARSDGRPVTAAVDPRVIKYGTPFTLDAFAYSGLADLLSYVEEVRRSSLPDITLNRFVHGCWK